MPRQIGRFERNVKTSLTIPGNNIHPIVSPKVRKKVQAPIHCGDKNEDRRDRGRRRFHFSPAARLPCAILTTHCPFFLDLTKPIPPRTHISSRKDLANETTHALARNASSVSQPSVQVSRTMRDGESDRTVRISCFGVG
ncbi:hypothetical protein AVEN_239086-1 [Araneus ventricosus]|uniref:Uncharacterized protein n=1 Tax=Araneus ventricosus TaxID=182803 RepID=A0A4Y2FTF6_ARAVE|nr:hypothetical protein AVEN_239086-1 [Araneus ventricosus]